MIASSMINKMKKFALRSGLQLPDRYFVLLYSNS